MKKLISLTLALIMIIACLSGLAVAADPTVPSEPGKPIAKATTGTKTTECKTVEEMLAAVDATGKSVITILQDFSYTDKKTMELPYSCTIDFDGHTVTGSKDEKTDAFTVAAVGTENNITTLKNGTLLFGRLGLRIWQGGFTASNMVMYGTNECLSPDDPAFKGENLIENCVLVSKEWGAFAYNLGGDFSGQSTTIKDSDLVSLKPAGSVLLDFGNSNTMNGKIVLGTGVNMYGMKIFSYAHAGMKLEGEKATKATATQTFENTALEIKQEGMTVFATPASPVAPVVPETPATPATPTTPEAPVPATGVSVVGLSILAAVSAAGAFVARKKEN